LTVGLTIALLLSRQVYHPKLAGRCDVPFSPVMDYWNMTVNGIHLPMVWMDFFFLQDRLVREREKAGPDL
jgi:hypothetical protein